MTANYNAKVMTLSLGEACQLNFYKPGSKVPSFSLCVEPNSLLQLEGKSYHEFMHGIDESDSFDAGIIFIDSKYSGIVKF